MFLVSRNVRMQLGDDCSAVDVVEHLLADVLNANQSYRQVQEKESRLINDLSLAQAQLFPLRKENARLARENHELHLDHIKQNEESRREMDRYAQKARELGDQITELRLMNKLYEQQVKEKDEIIEKLREVRGFAEREFLVQSLTIDVVVVYRRPTKRSPTLP